MRKSLLSMAIFLGEIAVATTDIQSYLGAEDLKEIRNLVSGIITSCPDKVLSERGAMELAIKEISDLEEGLGAVLSESLLTMAIKKGYPTACHVLSTEELKNIEKGEDKETVRIKEKITKSRFKVSKKHFSYPRYTYYWPKYFIEVSNKGNDPHPAFAAGNKFYEASRLVANKMSKGLNLQGPQKLTATVLGTANLMKSLGVNLSPKEEDLSRFEESLLLLPFEKLRMRANQEPDMPSFEVNIWPVGLSQTIAKQLTCCGEGGFSWPMPGVPMVCPIAMTQDAWSYWDTGMLDYLNPSVPPKIKAASNPLSCLGTQLAKSSFEKVKGKKRGEALEKREKKEEKEEFLKGLPNNLRGLGMCSLPILGDTEAILNSTLALKDAFKGPWCSAWGSIFPRASTHILNNEFSYPLAALKFKLLARDLFGTPEGKDERWALAYPWEESMPADIKEYLIKALKSLARDVLKKPSLAKSFEDRNYLARGRSVTLYPAGDPRLIDTASKESITVDMVNAAKEAAYILSMEKVASTAEKEAVRRFAPKSTTKTVKEVELQGKQDLEKSEDLLLPEEVEITYEERFYCHISGEKRGFMGEAEKHFRVNGMGSGALERPFFKVRTLGECLHKRISKNCLKRHKVTRKCLRRESVYRIAATRWEEIRRTKKKRPKRYYIKEEPCHSNEYKTPTLHHHDYSCKETLTTIPLKRNKRLTIDARDPEKTLGQDDEASRKAGQIAAIVAKSTPWVAAEIARVTGEQALGKSYLPGRKRVYTIFEKISCQPRGKDGRRIRKEKISGVYRWSECEAAIRLGARRYFQTTLLRRLCDKLLKQPLGKPFKESA